MEECRCTEKNHIEELSKDMKKLKGVVLEGNGDDSLQFMAKQTRDHQKNMDDNLWKLNSNVEELMKFQNKYEAERDYKLEQREKRLQKTRWVIPMLVGAVVTLLITLFELIIK